MSGTHQREDIDTTTHDERRGAPIWKRYARAGAWLRLAAVAAALALGPLGCGKPAPPDSVAPAKARAPARHAHQAREAHEAGEAHKARHSHQAREAHRARRADGLNEATAQFMAFALNALLVPLLDDDVPPRWADPSLAFDCDAGAVKVDDAPLDVGAPVPDQAFTVRWHMERCAPFDDAMQLTGDVELRVEPRGTDYRAVVQPLQLHVVLGARIRRAHRAVPGAHGPRPLSRPRGRRAVRPGALGRWR